MIIGIDASKAAVKERTGIENYVYQLILNLKALDRDHIYFLYTNAPLPTELVNSVNFVEKLIPFTYAWNSFFLPLSVYKNPCDVYLQPTDRIPWSAPKKSIGVIHDLAWKYFPNAYNAKNKYFQIKAIKSLAKKDIKTICVSRSTENDLIKFYPVFKKKTKVISLGYDNAIFHQIAKPKNILKLKEKFILFTGRLEERKNLVRLIRAFVILKNEYKITHKLVLAGSPGYNFDLIKQEIRKSGNFANDIIIPGHIGHDQLPDILSAADVFAFPTLYEGFGLPIIEAMACGAPVLTSGASSMPEVAGKAALFCNPLDENDIAKKLYKLISDEKLRKQLTVSGLNQAAKFSWQKTAEETLTLLENL